MIEVFFYVCQFSFKFPDSGTDLEREKLRLEYETEMEKLRDQYNAERKSKSKMEADLQSLKEQYQRGMENIGNNNVSEELMIDRRTNKR